ncbi:palmitoyl-protein thioesterase 1 [Xylariaceae sp. FL0016]|nr:palmitoyl-protein thioesterase 1 [Xylariaceae sp. FL0016]
MPTIRTLPVLLTFATSVLAAVANPTAQQPITSHDDDDDDTPLPVVIWHGLGDTYSGEGIQTTADLITQVHPGTYVYVVRMDDSGSSDRSATFWGDVNGQVAKACADIAADPILSTAPALDALGYSQGGQFLRAYAERCSAPPLRSLVTFGSQHNGILDYRACSSTDWLCKGAMALLHGQTWSDYVQTHLVPAQYFRNPSDMSSYLEHSNFLADINNERDEKNATYAKNMEQLSNFVMYLFEDDETVIPKETGWFEDVNGTEVTPLRARPLYTEDWIGLRALDRKGGLKFRTTPGAHMQIPDKVLKEAFDEFFGPYTKDFAADSEAAGEL